MRVNGHAVAIYFRRKITDEEKSKLEKEPLFMREPDASLVDSYRDHYGNFIQHRKPTEYRPYESIIVALKSDFASDKFAVLQVFVLLSYISTTS